MQGIQAFRRFFRFVAAPLFVICMQTANAGPAFIDQAIHSESGFDGAVTVVESAADAKDADIGYVTVEIPYRDINGAPKKGQGRLVVRKQDLESGKPIPPFCHVHYEKDVGGAKKWCKRGWAVATAHYGAPPNGYPLELCVADSNNLARALIEWVRRLPFIDRTHLHIDGGSAGGYMALAMGAEFFPVAAVTADAPVCNWAYNVNYLVANKPVSKYPLPDFKGPADLKRTPLPIMYSITGLGDQVTDTFGNDLSSDAFFFMSPIAYLDRITCPTLILCATGDMLVPLEQMTNKIDRPIDKALFPEGYSRDFDRLTLSPKAKRLFVDLVPQDQLSVQAIPLTEGMHEYTLANFTKEEKEPAGPPNVERPWNKDKQWNIAVLDEGPPKPFSAHTRYKWSTSPDSFVDAYQKAAPQPSILNAPKLDRLLQRYAGELKDEAVVAKTGKPANRLNYQTLEKLDVVSGLLDYAGLGTAYADNLSKLYTQGTLKPFGDAVSLEKLREEHAALRKSLALQ